MLDEILDLQKLQGIRNFLALKCYFFQTSHTELHIPATQILASAHSVKQAYGVHLGGGCRTLSDV